MKMMWARMVLHLLRTTNRSALRYMIEHDVLASLHFSLPWLLTNAAREQIPRHMLQLFGDILEACGFRQIDFCVAEDGLYLDNGSQILIPFMEALIRRAVRDKNLSFLELLYDVLGRDPGPDVRHMIVDADEVCITGINLIPSQTMS